MKMQFTSISSPPPPPAPLSPSALTSTRASPTSKTSAMASIAGPLTTTATRPWTASRPTKTPTRRGHLRPHAGAHQVQLVQGYLYRPEVRVSHGFLEPMRKRFCFCLPMLLGMHK
ncbi:hypothetical protein DPSP01_008118 [Paraphaeosphaeria sporulosa]